MSLSPLSWVMVLRMACFSRSAMDWTARASAEAERCGVAAGEAWLNCWSDCWAWNW